MCAICLANGILFLYSFCYIRARRQMKARERKWEDVKREMFTICRLLYNVVTAQTGARIFTRIFLFLRAREARRRRSCAVINCIYSSLRYC